ncbi:hypothetical protein PXK01_19600 [Phaeobacter sp. PT47_59]|uniref:hypothetical protein n=1 Tax=Phaeobacter sp. PT47_59 TaxID=3029979 RepID=UPI002380188A|nr:hypothetical protein [Phaeobacter sp. PT47_59]MDE4176367.1 hypothetical protein [Phaeobacter sp. PT47_59]
MVKGGQMGGGPKFTGLGDMFDGGGAGASGGAFKGHNGFTNVMAAIGNGLKGMQPENGATSPFKPQQKSQIAPPPRPAMPQMPEQPRFGEGTGPHSPDVYRAPQGPLMPYGETEITDDYLSRLIQRANQGDETAMQLLQHYDQGRL